MAEVLVGRGYIHIRPRFDDDFMREIRDRLRREGEGAGRGFGNGFGNGIGDADRALGNLTKTAVKFGRAFAAAGASIPVAMAALGAGAKVAQVALNNLVPALQLGVGAAILGLGIKAQLATDKVKKAFEDAGKSITASFTRASSSLGPVLEKLAGRATSVVKGLEPAFTKFFKNVSPALDRLFASIEKILKNPAVAKFIEESGVKLAEALDKIAKKLPEIIAKVKQVFNEVKQAVNDLVAKTQPFVDMFKAAWPIIKQVAQGVRDLANAFVTGFGEQMKPVTDRLKELAGDEGFMKKLKQFMQDMTPVARILGQVLGTVLGIALLLLIEAVKLVVDAWDWLKRKWNEAKVKIDELKKKFDELKKNISDFVADMKQKLSDAQAKIDEWKRKWDEFVARMRALPGQARAALDSLVEAFTAPFRNAYARASGAVSEGNERVAGFVRRLPGMILGALGNPGALLAGAGRAIMNGLLGGLTERLGALRAKAGEIASTIKGFFPNSPKAKWGALHKHPPESFGSAIGRGIVAGLAGRADDLRAELAGMASLVGTSLGGTSGLGALSFEGALETGRGAAVYVTNHFPQAEPTSLTVNRAIQLAASLGV